MVLSGKAKNEPYRGSLLSYLASEIDRAYVSPSVDDGYVLKSMKAKSLLSKQALQEREKTYCTLSVRQWSQTFQVILKRFFLSILHKKITPSVKSNRDFQTKSKTDQQQKWR
ncbi:hypothetical protein SRHO_G00103050 [Serrasalmus rhombeus]